LLLPNLKGNRSRKRVPGRCDAYGRWWRCRQESRLAGEGQPATVDWRCGEKANLLIDFEILDLLWRTLREVAWETICNHSEHVLI
jgi:hypothetical protein